MYSDRLLEHYRQPRNRGELAQADLDGEEINALCGDQVRIQARLRGEQIEEAMFSGRGCALCLGAASILTDLIVGRSLDDLQAMCQADFLSELGASIRPARLRCALLPWLAFRRAAFGETEDAAAQVGGAGAWAAAGSDTGAS